MTLEAMMQVTDSSNIQGPNPRSPVPSPLIPKQKLFLLPSLLPLLSTLASGLNQ